jgi:triphosphoribosyl-dephospho-CoA synthase
MCATGSAPAPPVTRKPEARRRRGGLRAARAPLHPPERVAAAAQIACLLELLAPKPGNVGRGRDLPGLTSSDLAASATAIGPVFRRSDRAPVGGLVLDAVRATRRHVATNTNLGIVLLVAPLAAAAARPGRGPYRRRLRSVLARLALADARDVFRAIRLAGPGGLGRVREQDLSRPPTRNLLACMRLAARRDAIAREYATVYRTTFAFSLPLLRRLRREGVALPRAVGEVFLRLLARSPDTLLRRRHGEGAARAVSRRAAAIVRAGGLLTPRGGTMARALDRDLRCSRPPLNPGATADLAVAALFLFLLESAVLKAGRSRPTEPPGRPPAPRGGRLSAPPGGRRGSRRAPAGRSRAGRPRDRRRRPAPRPARPPRTRRPRGPRSSVRPRRRRST